MCPTRSLFHREPALRRLLFSGVVAAFVMGCSGASTSTRASSAAASSKRARVPAFTSIEPFAEEQLPVPPGMLVLAQEVERAMAALETKGALAPYFIGQELMAYDTTTIAASNGALAAVYKNQLNVLMTDVRVGSYDLDSTHPIDAEGEEVSIGSMTSVPLDAESLDALARIAWRQIEGEYQSASERFLAVKTQGSVKVDIEDRSGDFSREQAVQHIGAPARAPELDEGYWQRRLRSLSLRLSREPGLYGGEASIEALGNTRWIVNSEGTKVQTGDTTYRLSIGGYTRAEDGMDLSRSEYFLATTHAGLPSDTILDEAAERVARDLTALRHAEPAEPFVGPAILSGRAAGVFFHETFGHRVEGERQKYEDEGQTFAKKVGERVMPAFLDVYDDPQLNKLGDIELGGFYRFDDEGVPAQRASVVEAGVLKGFLMSRVPVRGVVNSNGHGRRLDGPAMARQANLVVQPRHALSDGELRRLLVEEARRQKKEYGLRFSEIEGGYAETVRESTQGYKLMPVMVYRVYTDGRPDELIRGVDIVGTPLISLTKVLAAGDDYAVFNGSCGAESGWVPVSAVSPSLLLQQIEVALRDKGNERPPILPPPEALGPRAAVPHQNHPLNRRRGLTANRGVSP